MLAACCRRVVRAAIKAELPGTARKMSLIVMDLIKSTLETIYDRMKSNVDEAFIKAVTDEMKSYVMTSPSGEQASLETNQSTQESNETQIRCLAWGRGGCVQREGYGYSWYTHPPRAVYPMRFYFGTGYTHRSGSVGQALVVWCTTTTTPNHPPCLLPRGTDPKGPHMERIVRVCGE